MSYFKTSDYLKELSHFDSTIHSKHFIKIEENNVVQITQTDFITKKKTAPSSRMAGFWQDSEWDDSKALNL
jgi:hypothetical protein